MGALSLFMLVTGAAALVSARGLLNTNLAHRHQVAMILASFGRFYFAAGLIGLIIIGAMQFYVIVTML